MKNRKRRGEEAPYSHMIGQENTKDQGKYWVFTCYNYEETNALDKSGYKYLIYQEECCPNTGRMHLQGYVCFSTNRRFNSLKALMPTAHWEKRRGSHTQAKEYCSKDETCPNKEMRFEAGDDSDIADVKGERTDILRVSESLLEGSKVEDIAMEYPREFIKYSRGIRELHSIVRDKNNQNILNVQLEGKLLYKWQKDAIKKILEQDDRKISFFIDELGGAGKTLLAKYLMVHHGAFYSLNGAQRDVAHAYNYQPIVVLDYTREYGEKYINYSIMEQFKNGLLSSSKYESTTKVFPPAKVVVFLNQLVPSGKLSEDRLDTHYLSRQNLQETGGFEVFYSKDDRLDYDSEDLACDYESEDLSCSEIPLSDIVLN